MSVNLSLRAFCAIILLFFVFGCGGEKKETESTSSIQTTDSSSQMHMSMDSMGTLALLPPERVSTDVAYQNIKRYVEKINPEGKYGDYVWCNISLMEEMLEEFKTNGKSHVKMYFALDERTICGETTQNLNIVFEGAKLTDHCNPKNCEICNLAEDPKGEGTYSYNLNHPCPPPRCSGRSRYYYHRPGESGKLREKPE